MVGCRTEDGDLGNLPGPPHTHKHTVLTLHPLTPCTPWGERPPPDLLQQGGQREFNTRVPHSSKVIIDVAAGRGSPVAG